MDWGGGILFYISKTLYKKSKNKKNVEKLKSGKADKTEWIYGKIPTQCDSCNKPFNRGLIVTGDGKGIMQVGPTCTRFITGWDESIFRIMCPNCYETFGSELRDVKVYNLETLEVANDDDTPEKREKSQRLRKWLGWG